MKNIKKNFFGYAAIALALVMVTVTAFAFTTNDVTAHDYTLENVEISRAFLGNCKNIFSVDEPGNITYSGLHGKYVGQASGEIVNP